jgi:hypothetical protein
MVGLTRDPRSVGESTQQDPEQGEVEDPMGIAAETSWASRTAAQIVLRVQSYDRTVIEDFLKAELKSSDSESVNGVGNDGVRR